MRVEHCVQIREASSQNTRDFAKPLQPCSWHCAQLNSHVSYLDMQTCRHTAGQLAAATTHAQGGNLRHQNYCVSGLLTPK